MGVKKLALALVAALTGSATFAQTTPDSTFKVIKDDPIVAALDSLASSKIMNSADFCPGFYYAGEDTAPYFDEATYRKRMAKLDAQSPFDLVYNDAVRGYIDMYTVKKRKVSAKMLGLAQHYFPLFEEKLDQFNLPLELKYLAIVESALNPSIRSRVGATGLWQFMYGTGKLFDLKVTSYVDDRCDPYKATVAACRYFTYLYNIYHDWSLVLAAYNSGPGNVNKAIRRAGGKMDYWSIRPYLPQETQGYVPAFIAVNYMMNYSDEHNLRPIVPPINAIDMDTVHLTHEVTLKQVGDIMNIPYENLRYWNPSYLLGVVPYNSEGSVLVLPRKDIARFVSNEKVIYEYADRAKPKTYGTTAASSANSALSGISASIKKVHVVKRGESIGAIANKYSVTTGQIRKWNGMKSNTVHTGQKLVIKNPAATTAAPASTEKKETAPSTTGATTENKGNTTTTENKENKEIPATEVKTTPKTTTTASTSKTIYYTVRKGDTLSSIAAKHHIGLTTLKNTNKLKSNNIAIGQKLKIVK